MIITGVRHATEDEKQNAPYQVSGFKQSPKDPRDWIFSATVAQSAELPTKSNNGKPPFIFDQGSKGSCTGNAGAYDAYYQERSKWGAQKFSRDFLYDSARKIDGLHTGSHANDDGSTGLAIMKVRQQYGVCLESTYNYRADVTGIRGDIPQAAFTEALSHRIKNYAKVSIVDEIKQAQALGKTVMAGVLVTDTFMFPDDGYIREPEGKLYGGHEICLFDYDDDMVKTFKNGKTYKGFVKFVNSWDEKWGDIGVGYLPYAFFSMVADFGSHFFIEGWTAIDLDSDPTPPQPEPKPQYTMVIEMWEGQTTAKVNGQSVTLDQPPVIINDRLVIPARFVSEQIGCIVDWDNEQRKVTIKR